MHCSKVISRNKGILAYRESALKCEHNGDDNHTYGKRVAYWLAQMRALTYFMPFVDSDGRFVGDWSDLIPEKLITQVETCASKHELREVVGQWNLDPHQHLIFAFLEQINILDEKFNNTKRSFFEFYAQAVLRQKALGALPQKANVIIETNSINGTLIPKDANFIAKLEQDTYFRCVEDTYVSNTILTKIFLSISDINDQYGMFVQDRDATSTENISFDKALSTKSITIADSKECINIDLKNLIPIKNDKIIELCIDSNKISARQFKELENFIKIDINSGVESLSVPNKNTANEEKEGVYFSFEVVSYETKHKENAGIGYQGIGELNIRESATYTNTSKNLYYIQLFCASEIVESFSNLKLSTNKEKIANLSDGDRHALLETINHLNLGNIKVNVFQAEVFDAEVITLETVCDVLTAFQPFSSPIKKNSSFSLRILNQPLIGTNKIRLKIDWLNIPDGGLKKYYQAYSLYHQQVSGKGDDFEIDESLFGMNWTCTKEGKSGDKIELDRGHTKLFSYCRDTLTIEVNYNIDKLLADSAIEGNGTGDIIFKFTLDDDSDFQEQYYNQVLQYGLTKSSSNPLFSASEKNFGIEQVNPPFIPEIEKITVFIETQCSNQKLNMHYAVPEVLTKNIRTSVNTFLPELDHEVALSLCFESLPEGNCLSILFKLMRRHFDYDKSDNPPWQIYTHKGWVPVKVLRDDTCELDYSGIVTFWIPGDIKRIGGLFVIQYTGSKNRLAFELESVLVNAVALTMNVDKHRYLTWNQAMQSGTKLDLDEQQPSYSFVNEIKNIQLPFPAAGGISCESENQVLHKVSNLIQHKQRLNRFESYEHFIVENFGEIMLAKCLPFNLVGKNTTILVLPRPEYPLDMSLLDGQRLPLNGVLLEEISSSLNHLKPLTAKLSIKTPYVKLSALDIELVLELGFRENYEYYAERVHETLSHLLNPYSPFYLSNIGFRQNLPLTVIRSEIENLSFVRAVTKINLRTKHKPSDHEITMQSIGVYDPSTEIRWIDIDGNKIVSS